MVGADVSPPSETGDHASPTLRTLGHSRPDLQRETVRDSSIVREHKHDKLAREWWVGEFVRGGRRRLKREEVRDKEECRTRAKRRSSMHSAWQHVWRCVERCTCCRHVTLSETSSDTEVEARTPRPLAAYAAPRQPAPESRSHVTSTVDTSRQG